MAPKPRKAVIIDEDDLRINLKESSNEASERNGRYNVNRNRYPNELRVR